MAKPRGKKLPRELKESGDLSVAFANTAAARRKDRRFRASTPPKPPATFADYGGLLRWLQKMGTLDAEDGERLESAARARPEEAKEVFERALELRDGCGLDVPIIPPAPG